MNDPMKISLKNQGKTIILKMRFINIQNTNVDWSPDDAFTLAIIVDTILAMVVITNCITFYPRMRSGPKFMKR